jgi:hypothetical protein
MRGKAAGQWPPTAMLSAIHREVLLVVAAARPLTERPFGRC